MNKETYDYGSDPLGDGNFKMVPSGDIVDRVERDARLSHHKNRRSDSIRETGLAMSWDEVEAKQGGRLKR